jgi:hypothetical protein
MAQTRTDEKILTMKWRPNFLFAVSLLLLIPDGSASNDVVVLDSENFDRLTKDSVWFVTFYAPWYAMFEFASTTMNHHCRLLQVWTLQKSNAAMGGNRDKIKG